MHTSMSIITNERQHVFTWKIENFISTVQKKDACIKSPLFTAVSLNRSDWYLSLYPRGVDWSDDIACFLNISDDYRGELECKFKLNLIGFEDTLLVSYESINKFKRGTSFGCYNFIRPENLESDSIYSSKNTLLIQCVMRMVKPETILMSENEAFTNIGVDQCYFTWTSKDVTTLNVSEIVKCPLLISCFTIDIKVLEDSVKIRIRRINGFSRVMSITCKVALLGITGNETDSRFSSHLFNICSPSIPDLFEMPDFIKISLLTSEKEKYLLNGAFTLQFEISISNGTFSNTIKEKVIRATSIPNSPSNMSLTTLQSNLRYMYNSKLFTDVVLCCDNETFNAHKCLLVSCSPVFQAMFCQDMVEKQTGLINIPDLEAKTLESLLEFLYTGNVRFPDYQKAIKLLIAADKYQIIQLVDECSDFLSSVLCVGNVCDILVSADLIQSVNLRLSAVDYIKKNRNKIFSSEEWKLCVAEYPKVASETILEVSSFITSNWFFVINFY